MMPWGHGWEGGFGGLEFLWGLLMMFLMVLFWGGLLALGYFLVRALIRSGQDRRSPHSDAGPSGSQALEILRERYARGEITKEQFEEIRRDLAS
jgi:putative membrane protein